jgi:hypothetical protein
MSHPNGRSRTPAAKEAHSIGETRRSFMPDPSRQKEVIIRGKERKPSNKQLIKQHRLNSLPSTSVSSSASINSSQNDLTAPLVSTPANNAYRCCCDCWYSFFSCFYGTDSASDKKNQESPRSRDASETSIDSLQPSSSSSSGSDSNIEHFMSMPNLPRSAAITIPGAIPPPEAAQSDAGDPCLLAAAPPPAVAYLQTSSSSSTSQSTNATAAMNENTLALAQSDASFSAAAATSPKAVLATDTAELVRTTALVPASYNPSMLAAHASSNPDIESVVSKSLPN